MLVKNCTFQLLIEPELRTNSPGSRIIQSQPYNERVYEPEGTGMMVKKGQEVISDSVSSDDILRKLLGT
jgi:phosphatidylserine decarboxylase